MTAPHPDSPDVSRVEWLYQDWWKATGEGRITDPRTVALMKTAFISGMYQMHRVHLMCQLPDASLDTELRNYFKKR
jgi:hypothetical protein